MDRRKAYYAREIIINYYEHEDPVRANAYKKPRRAWIIFRDT